MFLGLSEHLWSLPDKLQFSQPGAHSQHNTGWSVGLKVPLR